MARRGEDAHPLLLGLDLGRQVVDVVVGHGGRPDRVLGKKGGSVRRSQLYSKEKEVIDYLEEIQLICEAFGEVDINLKGEKAWVKPSRGPEVV